MNVIFKIGIVLLFIIITPIISGLYGILHDQITCTISPEYFTEFKFIQFRLAEEVFYNNNIPLRQGASVIGFLATWWVGFPIGIIIGLFTLQFKGGMAIVNGFKSLFIVFVVAIFIGALGYLISFLFLDVNNYLQNIPNTVINKQEFLNVGMIHNFSYLGGGIGLILAIVYLIRIKLKIKK
jgi:hypothetical protein